MNAGSFLSGDIVKTNQANNLINIDNMVRLLVLIYRGQNLYQFSPFYNIIVYPLAC
jgi:hypothetical protein